MNGRQIEVEIGASQPASGMCADLEPFALQVTDMSMEPEFAQGCIVIIDPSITASDGAFVLVEDAAHGWYLAQLRRSDSGWKTHALNPARAAPHAIGIEQVRGVVTQRAGRRRSYFKRYS